MPAVFSFAGWKPALPGRAARTPGPPARTGTAQGSGGSPNNVICSTRPQRGEGQSKALSSVTDRCGCTGSVPRPGRHSPCCIRGAASTAPSVFPRTTPSARRVGVGSGSSTPRSARSAAGPLPPGSDLTGYATSVCNGRPVFAMRVPGLCIAAPQAARPSLSVRASAGLNMSAI